MKELVLKKDPNTGVFFVRPYLGKSVVTKKPIRPYKCFPEAKDEDEARRAAEAWAQGLAKSAQLNVRRRAGELMFRYVQWRKDHGSPTNTVKTYRTCAKTAARYLKDADPDGIAAFEVDLLLNALQWKGGGLRGGDLAANTVRRMHSFLCSFWNWMLSEGICTTSPMPMVPKPSYEKPVPFIFTEGEMEQILGRLAEIMADDSTDAEHVLERNYATASYLAAMSSIREGESCGLDRGDLVPRQLAAIVCATAVPEGGNAVRQPKPKGKKSRRVPIDEDTMGEMGRHMAWQDSFLPARVLEKGRHVPLFCDSKGRRLKPAGLSAWFSGLCEDLGLPPESHFHALRHTWASEALDGGADIRTVAEILGHVREGFTLETYTHMMPGRDHEAAAIVARRYRGGRDP